MSKFADRRLSDHVTDTIRLPATTHHWLKRHAFERQVDKAQLVRDILQAWVAIFTDWENPLFNPESIHIERVDMPKERYPGYLATLGYPAESVRTLEIQYSNGRRHE